MAVPSCVLAAVGDVVLLHPISASMTDPASARVLDLLRTADVAIANCELSAFDAACPGPTPQAESGGLWLRAAPDCVADLRALGFTMLSRANNHAGDFGIPGMEATDRLLAESRIVHAGTGSTLAAARAPAYLTTRAGRTALVSATDWAPRHTMAGHARPDIAGRPGVNQIRTEHIRVVDAATFDVLASALDLARGQGHPIGELLEQTQEIRGLGPLIRKGDSAEDVYALSVADVEENLGQVRVARFRADRVVFALHTHVSFTADDMPPRAVRELARRVIEAGADAVVGHGPHRLRGIEIHQGRPIFYSLGNFVFHVSKIGPQPADLYESLGLAASAPLADLFGPKSIFWLMLSEPQLWQSVIALIIDDGPTRRVELHPVELSRNLAGWQLGTPRLADADTAREILERLAVLSAPLGTVITCSNGVGVIDCST